MSSHTPTLRRTTAAFTVLLVSALGLLVLASRMAQLLAARSLDDLVALGIHGVGVFVLGWYLLTSAVTTACLLARAAGRRWHEGEHLAAAWGAPFLRRLAAGGVAAVAVVGVSAGFTAPALATAPAPATAAAVPREPETADYLPDDLGWGAPAPEDPGDAAGTDEPDRTEPEEPGPGDGVTVVGGDTLWALAQADLGPGATDAQIAAAWPSWFEANRDVIGPDPDVIVPGLVLFPPTHESQESA